MNRWMAGIAALVCAAGAPAAWSAGQKFPGKGTVTIVTGPLPLLVHYLDGGGKPVKVPLRDLNYAKPDLTRSKLLNALAKRPCGAGDIVNIPKDAIGAEATKLDAAGIGNFSWLVTGQYTSDGKRWWFKGEVKPKDGPYNFDAKTWGARDWWKEVATRLGAAFPGKEFDVYMTGSLPVSIDGVCNLNSAGQAIV